MFDVTALNDMQQLLSFIYVELSEYYLVHCGLFMAYQLLASEIDRAMILSISAVNMRNIGFYFEVKDFSPFPRLIVFVCFLRQEFTLVRYFVCSGLGMARCL